jgi:hypothetical protein
LPSEYLDAGRRQADILTKHAHPNAALGPLADEGDNEGAARASMPTMAVQATAK